MFIELATFIYAWSSSFAIDPNLNETSISIIILPVPPFADDFNDIVPIFPVVMLSPFWMSVFVLLDMNGLSVVIPILDIVAELLPDNFAYTLQVMVSFGSALVGQSNDMSMLLELACYKY